MIYFQVSLIIETTDLSYISPSIVSCCGLVYYALSTVEWNMYLKSWIQNLENEKIRINLAEITNTYLEEVLDYSLTLVSFKVISLSFLSYATSFTKIMDTLFKKVNSYMRKFILILIVII